MNDKNYTAPSLEDAITMATMDLGIPSDQLEYEVVEKGSRGFLGIGSRQTVIRAWKKEESTEAPEVAAAAPKEAVREAKAPMKKAEPVKPAKEEKRPEPVKEKAEEKKEKHKTTENDNAHFEEGKKFLEEVFDRMGMKVQIDYRYNEEENALEIDLSGDEMGVLIGKRGQTLDSLQYLTGLVVNKSGEHYIRVKLDTENYRERRRETLEALAKNIAYKVKRTRKSVSLEPMNPYERRIIHAALQPDNFVMTRSEGEEPYRHVVVFYRRNKNGEER